MEAKIAAEGLEFSGHLDENSSLEAIVKVYNKAKEKMGPNMTLDLSKVTGANSAGIVTWLKFLEQSEATFCYVNCPGWLVAQFNMIKNFFPNNSFTRSIMVGFYSEEEDEAKEVIMVIGKEVPLLDNYGSYSLEPRKIQGKTYQPDVVEQNYFKFIAENLEVFKKQLG